MELRNLLNDPMSEDSMSQKQRALKVETEGNTFPLDAKQPSPQNATAQQQAAMIGSSSPKYGTYPGEYNGNRIKSPPGAQSQAQISPTSTANSALLQFAQMSQQYTPPGQEWKNQNANGVPRSYDYTQVSAAFKQVKGDKTPTNGGSNQTEREIRHAQPLQSVAAALKTIERYDCVYDQADCVRYKVGTIKNEIPIKDSTTLTQEFPEYPFIIGDTSYETPLSQWASTWKPELLEKTYPEIYIRDQKNSKDIKRRISEFRQHVENLQPAAEDEIWFAKDIPIMHTTTCMNSKKNKNCMGCSTYWKAVQTIQEDVRPWGNNDLLHFEPGHSETFLGHISMNGSFSPAQREMLACDAANTLFYTDDTAGVAIWGFISPVELHKLTEEDSLGIQFYDHKTFIDPIFLEKKVKVTYAVQRPGHTIIIPSGWIHWCVKVGRGLSFSASWNFLRLKHVTDSKASVDFNRSLGIYKPVNIASLLIAGAYSKLDEYEYVEAHEERRAIVDFLFRVLPVLRTLVLEELLGEEVPLSGIAVLSYDQTVEKIRKNGRSKLPILVAQELQQIHSMYSNSENDVTDDDDDVQYSCYQCKYILFNSRRSCMQCKGYDLCEPCYAIHGRSHPHKLKKYRRLAVGELVGLVDSIIATTQEQEDLIMDTIANTANPAPYTFPTREKDVISPTKTEPKDKEYKEPKEFTRETREATRDKDYKDKDYKDKDYKEQKEPKRKRRETAQRDRETTSPPQSAPAPLSGENYDSEVIDCICGNNKDLGFMISCEKCLAWLHGKCVGISKRNEPEEYYCPRCEKKSAALNAAAKLVPKSFSPERKLKEYKLA